jgi:hypothetical protein
VSWRKALSIAVLSGVLLASGLLFFQLGQRWMSSWRVTSAGAPASAAAPDNTLAEYTATGLKILHFYAVPGVVGEGEEVTICYGVRNAATLHLDPAVEKLEPSINRCFFVAPEQTTTYTLTAEDHGGQMVKASFEVLVRPDVARMPHIRYFSLGGKQPGHGGDVHTLCFQADNAHEVAIEPAAAPPFRGPKGCFYVSPRETTTYTLVVTDSKGRKTRRQATVPVP